MCVGMAVVLVPQELLKTLHTLAGKSYCGNRNARVWDMALEWKYREN
jgi:hypothetical protein